MNGAKKSLKENFILLYGVHFSIYLLPLFLVPYLARILGESSWGEVLFAQSIAIYIALIIEFGFGISGTKNISVNRSNMEKIASIFSNIISCQILIALSLILIFITILLFIKPTGNLNIYYSSLIMGVFQGLIPLWFFRGLEEMRSVAFLQITSKILAVILIILLVKESSDNWIVIACFAFSNFVSYVLSIVYTINNFNIHSIKIKKVKRMFIEGLNLFWVRAGATLFTEGNIIVVGLFMSNQIVGNFGSALKIINAAKALLNPAGDVLFPRISNLVKNQHDNSLSLIKKSLIGMSLIGIILSLLFYIGSEVIVSALLGEDYIQSSLHLKILSPLLIIVALSLVLGSQWLISHNYEKIFSRIILICGLVNILVSYSIAYNGLTIYLVSFNIVFSQLVILGCFIIAIMKYRLNPFSTKFNKQFIDNHA